MIEEPCLVAVDAGVDDGLRVYDEEERVGVRRVLALVAPVGLLVRHPLAEVLDDACALADAAQGESAQAMDRRSGAPRTAVASAMSDRHRRGNGGMMLVAHELEVLEGVVEQGCGRRRMLSRGGGNGARESCSLACSDD